MFGMGYEIQGKVNFWPDVNWAFLWISLAGNWNCPTTFDGNG
jgi:hypothetical protein